MFRRLSLILLGAAAAWLAYAAPAGAGPLPGPTPSAASPETSFLEPAGCLKPPDDYTRLTVNNLQLDARTLAMLRQAAALYAGPIDVTGPALTQGSFSQNGPASFGTHLGGGVVDISVLQPGGRAVLYHEIEPLIRALRAAGFAAWLRDWNDLGPGSGIHIHAVAIGDRDLSPEALDQLTGPAGYFRGLNGLPANPALDKHSGPLLCAWMRDLGYSDLRPAAARTATPPDWRKQLQQTAARYVTANLTETRALALQIDFRPGKNEDPSNMCGPLAAAILRDAGLLPAEAGPVGDPRRYWLANPAADGRPWTLFSKRDYDLFHFSTPINRFDFGAWPLRPGDFLYTYQTRDGYEHMLVVTEVDAQGRAYTVTNNKQADLTHVVQRVLLYDPRDPAIGAFKWDWVRSPILGRTGLGGFDVLRAKGKTLPPGSLYAYTVSAGDTLASLAYAYGSSAQVIARQNRLSAPYALAISQTLTIPVNTLFANPAAANNAGHSAP